MTTPEFKTDAANADYEAWSKWRTSKHPDDLEALLDITEPTIHRAIFSRRNSGIPEQALKTHAKLLAVKAFESYDPKQGVQLNTHMTNQLQKVSRLVYNYQDITHIPEHTQLQIGTYKKAKELLHDKLDRDATTEELQDELHWSPKAIGRMEKSLRKVLLGSQGGDIIGQVAEVPDRQKEVMHFIYQDLRPQEKAVWEHATGWYGKPQIKGDEAIGKALKMGPHEVRRTRESIAAKFKHYMGQE